MVRSVMLGYVGVAVYCYGCLVVFLKWVLVGGVVAAIVIVVADVGLWLLYVFFLGSCGLWPMSRGFWCGGMVVVSGFVCVFCGQCIEEEVGRERNGNK